MFRVLVVEDSAVVRELIVYILESDPTLQVIGIAKNGEEAVEAAQNQQPDIITMDVNMPKMDGFEATRLIMETAPKPIVIVTASWDPKEVATSFRAMEAGAVAVLGKPPGIGHPDHLAMARELVQTVKNMAEVKVVRRWARYRKATPPATSAIPSTLREARDMRDASGRAESRFGTIRLVAIGTSTGGPMALQALLSGIPSPFPVPIVIVQHMAAGFITGFVEWLGNSTGHPTHVAADGDSLLAGHVYVAPDGHQMRVKSRGKIELTLDEAEYGLSPSVSYLFRSVAEHYGAQAIGVLLTGMGRDGAAELKLMRDAGAVTFVQDKESSVIHGMPGEAIRLDAATYVMSPERIAGALLALCHGPDDRMSNHPLSDHPMPNPHMPDVQG